MNRVQWLLDRLGRRLVAWSAALARDSRIAELAPPVGEPVAPPAELPAEPFDAKRHWLDRVAHLPPQAWQQGGKPAPPRPALPRSSIGERDARPNVPIEPRSSEASRALHPAPVAQREAMPPSEMRRRPAEPGVEQAVKATRSVVALPTVRAMAAAAHPSSVVPSVSLSAAATPPVCAEPAPGRSVPLRLAPERPVQAAEPTPLEWPAEHEVGSLGRPAHSPSTGPEPTRVDRIERGDEPRRAWPAPIAFESSDAPWLDHDEARSASPVAEFDLRRTHAPDLPQPPMTPALPRPRALPTPAHDAPLVTRRNERSEPGFTVDSNPPARRWPDLPPWPAPHDPWAHAADPHARDRRQRLDHEQRG